MFFVLEEKTFFSTLITSEISYYVRLLKNVDHATINTLTIKGANSVREITMEDLFQAIHDLSADVKNVQGETTNIKTEIKEIKSEMKDMQAEMKEMKSETKSIKIEMKDMKDELKQDIRKVDQKVTILSNDILEAKADITLLQKEVY